MRRLVIPAVVVAIVAIIALVGAPGAARADVMPSGRIAAAVGIRNGTAALNDKFGLGVLYGLEAAWEPLADGQKLGYVLHWNVLFGDFGRDEAAITGELDTLEMGVGLRLRLAPDRTDPARTLFVGGGGALLRANVPLPPDDERSYFGGFVGMGLEQLAWSRGIITLELRYGLIGPGPGSVSVLLSGGLGV